MKKLCEYKHIENIEAYVKPDHNSYVAIHTAKAEYRRAYGIFEMKKHLDDI